MSANTETILLALDKLKHIELTECFDGLRPGSRPTEKQEAVFQDAAHVFARYVVAGNQSGKSTIGARETAWVFNRNHPYWDLNEQFGDQPLLQLVIGRVGEQVESELWARKIKPLLIPGTYKEVRTGNSLQRVIHKETGNTIIFMSHHNVNEAREKAQAYTAHFVWIDEMPNSLSLILELQLRVQANNGRLLATFTPLIRNKAIRDLIENSKTPLGRKYKFGMSDNPIYKGREQEIIDRYKDVPEDERAARLFGEWFKGGRYVYNYNHETQGRDPDNYHPSWPHVEIVDPAGTGKAGFMLLANQPGTRRWYCVKAEYVPGAAATDLLPEFEKRTKGYNIVRRVCDPHETWFIKEAAKQKRHYMGVYNKRERKMELIKGLQESLTHGSILITTWVGDLVDELETCMWSETKDGKIVGSSRFHLLDCLQYGNDNLPRLKEVDKPKTHDQWLREANKKRKENEAKRKVRGGRFKRW